MDQLMPAGFWRRLCAGIIDSAVLVGFLLLLRIFFPILVLLTPDRMCLPSPFPTLFGILLPWIYSAGFESSPAQATPGQQMLRLKVYSTEYQRISFWRASWRYLLFVSPVGLGFFFIFFTARKQMLHDLWSRTIVLKSHTPN